MFDTYVGDDFDYEDHPMYEWWKRDCGPGLKEAEAIVRRIAWKFAVEDAVKEFTGESL